MNIELSPKAEKELKRLPKLDQIAVGKKIRNLKDKISVIQEEKLSGFQNVFRVRVGNYRIVYKKTTQEIYIVLIRHRRDVYRLVNQMLK